MKRMTMLTAAVVCLSMTGVAVAQTATGTDAATKPGSDAPKSGQAGDIKQQESKGATVKAGPNAATGITVGGNAGAGGGGTPASQ